MEDELHAVLSFLTYPAPKLPRLRLTPEEDLRPITLRFLLFTAARREEMVAMKWGDVDFSNKVWRKPSIKSIKGQKRSQSYRCQTQHWTSSLPGFGVAKATDLVFQNGSGSTLGNWDRFQKALMEATKTLDWHRHDLR